jgi:hypothetical protein
MVTVEYRIPNGARPENTHIRAVRDEVEALALSAHCVMRGYMVLCIKRHGAIAMTAHQIDGALARIHNRSPGAVTGTDALLPDAPSGRDRVGK